MFSKTKKGYRNASDKETKNMSSKICSSYFLKWFLVFLKYIKEHEVHFLFTLESWLITPILDFHFWLPYAKCQQRIIEENHGKCAAITNTDFPVGSLILYRQMLKIYCTRTSNMVLLQFSFGSNWHILHSF